MNQKVLLAVLVSATMAFGCKKDDKKDEAKKATPEATKTADKTPEATPETTPEAVPPEAEMQPPAFAALVSHKVADFDKWKVSFDAHAEMRKGAGVLGHHLSQNADDPNMVHVYLPMNETEKFSEMAKSEDMKKVMMEAGVQGEPTVTMMKPVAGKPVLDRDIPGAVIMHEVEDFDKWKAGYDEHAEMRAAAGIVGDAVNRVVENENMVVVLLQADEAEKLTAFFASPDLKEAMAKAGVKGEPTITMINSMASPPMH